MSAAWRVKTFPAHVAGRRDDDDDDRRRRQTIDDDDRWSAWGKAPRDDRAEYAERDREREKARMRASKWGGDTRKNECKCDAALYRLDLHLTR